MKKTYAGFWRRVWAALVDGLILYIPTEFIYWFLFKNIVKKDFGAFLSYEFGGNPAIYWEYEIWGFCVISFLSSFYFAYFHSSKWQATVGKRLLKIKVTNLAGERISFFQAFGRYFASFVSILLLGIGLIMTGMTKQKRALHDYMSGTIVIFSKK